MAELLTAFTYRDVTVTLAGGGGNITYSTSTGALHASGTQYTLVGEPGDISITFGGSDSVRVLDRGVFDQLRLGDDQPSEISGSAQFRDMLDGTSTDTLVGWLTALRDGTANNKNSTIPESTSVSAAGADDAEVMSCAIKVHYVNAGSGQAAAVAWNICTCSSFSIAESAGDVTRVSFTFVGHDKSADVYQE